MFLAWPLPWDLRNEPVSLTFSRTYYNRGRFAKLIEGCSGVCFTRRWIRASASHSYIPFFGVARRFRVLPRHTAVGTRSTSAHSPRTLPLIITLMHNATLLLFTSTYDTRSLVYAFSYTLACIAKFATLSWFTAHCTEARLHPKAWRPLRYLTAKPYSAYKTIETPGVYDCKDSSIFAFEIGEGQYFDRVDL